MGHLLDTHTQLCLSLDRVSPLSAGSGHGRLEELMKHLRDSMSSLLRVLPMSLRIEAIIYLLPLPQPLGGSCHEFLLLQALFYQASSTQARSSCSSFVSTPSRCIRAVASHRSHARSISSS
mmetsp:Transcript_19679/g.31573  ORF Transcript_19679/g.31573 Transcript_19679/m.31573 type:complete len:121 (+) Transcript_19679:736-1098(+)